VEAAKPKRGGVKKAVAKTRGKKTAAKTKDQ
jgi:hypothetical protein